MAGTLRSTSSTKMGYPLDRCVDSVTVAFCALQSFFGADSR